MRYLYHYTSLDTLALILKNKTICFNNLLNVDDIEEAETEDMGSFGRYIYVSCWTSLNEESIPFWNMYTPSMHGVRIRLKELPFRSYHYSTGEYHFTVDCDSYIDYQWLCSDNKARITSDQPLSLAIDYTDDETLLHPTIRTESTPGLARMIAEGGRLPANGTVRYNIKQLGRHKRRVWEFQNEWRYLISLAPVGMNESIPNTNINFEAIRRIEDPEMQPPYERIFLRLADDAFDDLEVVFGPRMTDAEQIMAEALLELYAPQAKRRKSTLRIR